MRSPAALAIVALLAGPSLAAAQVPAGVPHDARGDAARGHLRGAWMDVTSAADLAGRSLRDPAGQKAGQVVAVAVDLEAGRVPFVLVGSAGALQLGDDLVAVPFGALRLPPDGNVVDVDRPAGVLAAAPSALRAPGGVRRVGPMHGGWLLSGLFGPDPVVEPPVPARTAVHRMGGILIRDLRGAAVAAPDGGDAGRVERVVIDMRTGRIAFVVLRQGGVLGFGVDRRAVPPQALSWSAADGAYRLHAAAPAPVPTADDAMPTQARYADLAALYDRFGIPAFWRPAPARPTALRGLRQDMIRTTLERIGLSEIEFVRPLALLSARTAHGVPLMLAVLPHDAPPTPEPAPAPSPAAAAVDAAAAPQAAPPAPMLAPPPAPPPILPLAPAPAPAPAPAATPARLTAPPRAVAGPAAASNITPGTVRSEAPPPLPLPGLPPGAAPADYLRAAQDAIAAGRPGAAQAALERAEVRLLGRAVPAGDVPQPDTDPAVLRIEEALDALATRDDRHAADAVAEAQAEIEARG